MAVGTFIVATRSKQVHTRLFLRTILAGCRRRPLLHFSHWPPLHPSSMVSVLPILEYGKVNGGLTVLLETLAYLLHRLGLDQSDCMSKGPDSHDVVGPSSPLPLFTRFEILNTGRFITASPLYLKLMTVSSVCLDVIFLPFRPSLPPLNRCSTHLHDHGFKLSKS